MKTIGALVVLVCALVTMSGAKPSDDGKSPPIAPEPPVNPGGPIITAPPPTDCEPKCDFVCPLLWNPILAVDVKVFSNACFMNLWNCEQNTNYQEVKNGQSLCQNQ